MRVAQLTVPPDRRDDVQRVLDDHEIEYVFTPAEGSAEGTLVQFPVAPDAVDEVLDALETAGIDSGSYTVLLSAEMATTGAVDRPSEQIEEGDDRIGHDEIRGRALEMNPGRTTYYAMTILSAIVAAAGLLLDSPAIVVGSMVIAPQVGSALAGSVGMALGDGPLVRRGFVEQVLGLGLAIVAAAVLGVSLRQVAFVSPLLQVTAVEQIGQRISPGFLSMAVGLCAGAAGAFGLATALPVSLVGVMIAAALIPAAAAVGVGIAWGTPSVALGAFVLLVVNVTAVNLAGFLVLWGLGYRPSGGRGGAADSEWLRTYRPTVAAVTVLLVALAVSGAAVGQQITVERQVTRGVSETLERAVYDELTLQRVQTRFLAPGFDGTGRHVSVSLRRPVGQSYPDLANALARTIGERLDTSVTVSVTYQEQQRSTGSNVG